MTTRTGVGADARVRAGTAAKKEGGSLVRRAQESDRIASLAPTTNKVRPGAVLLSSSGAEHQAIGSLLKPTDGATGSHRLEKERNSQPHPSRPAQDPSQH